MLALSNICKKYPSFALDNVSFSLEPGYIMGFIGRNGAGKTTTLKSVYNLIGIDSGSIELFGRPLSDFNERELKQDVALSLAGLNIFPTRKIGTIAAAVKPFYQTWDEEEYRRLLDRFALEEDKRFKELSNGMKAKFILTLAMSHRAKLLILDEPTSGLDPFSRDEIMALFQDFIKDGEHSILFSTQIVSDLEQVADFITYIKDGKIVQSSSKDAFVESYRLIRGTLNQYESLDPGISIGSRRSKVGFEALIKTADSHRLSPELLVEKPTIEQIMILTERGN